MWHHHGSDTPTSHRAILHHTDPNAPNISGGSVLDLWGIGFHSVVVFDLGKKLLFKSILGRCARFCKDNADKSIGK